jgi:hypothetical protein
LIKKLFKYGKFVEDVTSNVKNDYLRFDMACSNGEIFATTYYFVDRANGLEIFFNAVQNVIGKTFINDMDRGKEAEWFDSLI